MRPLISSTQGKQRLHENFTNLVNKYPKKSKKKKKKKAGCQNYDNIK